MANTFRPFGSWVSPIDAADTISKTISFVEIHPDGDVLHWIEMRPAEGGRQVLVRRDGEGRIEDLTPPPVNVRTRVHEYGGGAVLAHDGVVYYSDHADHRLYRLQPGSAAHPITPEPKRPGSARYADGRVLPDGRLVYVRETHPESGEARNDLVIIDPKSGELTIASAGADFYSNPRPSPDGSHLCWLEWDHPNMPWDGTRLMTAPIEGDGLGSARLQIAGGPDESVFQPEWASDGTILFAADPTGWWNLYRSDGSETRPIHRADLEFGLPQWLFGRSVFAQLGDDRILAAYIDQGTQLLGVIDGSGALTALDLGFSYYSGLCSDGHSRAWFAGYRPNEPAGLFELDVDGGELTEIHANPQLIPEGYRSVPRLFSFSTGVQDADTAYGIFYCPANPDHTGPVDEQPPLIVHVHGGPTSWVFAEHDVGYAYWTSRGIGVVDVNYRGSTGFGRTYREKLNGEWGVVDVEDCIAAARHLAAEGLVDGERLIITGGSAGGYTTLAALAFGDTFGAGASYYGVADISLLADHTHKFESRYLDRLVGTDPELMEARSPLYAADRIEVPVILFQGLEDQVVPPEQAEMIAAALEENGVPYAHVTYPGEDHGFRDAKNIVHSLESELVFYGRVLGFEPAGDLPEVDIVGM